MSESSWWGAQSLTEPWLPVLMLPLPMFLPGQDPVPESVWLPCSPPLETYLMKS